MTRDLTLDWARATGHDHNLDIHAEEAMADTDGQTDWAKEAREVAEHARNYGPIHNAAFLEELADAIESLTEEKETLEADVRDWGEKCAELEAQNQCVSEIATTEHRWRMSLLDENKALIEKTDTLTQERDEARAALKYARPLVEKWCHSQGNNKQFHHDTLAPIDAALSPQTEGKSDG